MGFLSSPPRLGTLSPPPGARGVVTKQLSFAAGRCGLWLCLGVGVGELGGRGRDGQSLGGRRGGSELALKWIRRVSGGEGPRLGAALRCAPLLSSPPRVAFPVARVTGELDRGARFPNSRARPIRSADVPDVRALAANAEEALDGDGKGRGAGPRGERRGSCGGPARALPHARAHGPARRRTRRNPPPAPARHPVPPETVCGAALGWARRAPRPRRLGPPALVLEVSDP